MVMKGVRADSTRGYFSGPTMDEMPYACDTMCADLFLPGCICFIFNVFHFYHFFQRARKCMLHAIDSSFRKEKIGIDRCSNVEHKLIKIFFFHSMH
jgi:hypothetical protein